MSLEITPPKEEKPNSIVTLDNQKPVEAIANNPNMKVVKVLSPIFKSFARGATICMSFIPCPHIKKNQLENFSIDLRCSATPNFCYEKEGIYPFNPRELCYNISHEISYMFKNNWIDTIVLFSGKMFRKELKPSSYGNLAGPSRLYDKASNMESLDLINNGVSKKFAYNSLYISIDPLTTVETSSQKIKEAIYEYDIYKLCDSLFMRNRDGWVGMNNLSRVTSGLDDADKIEYEIYDCHNGNSNMLSQLGILYYTDPNALMEKHPNYYKAIKRLIKMFAPKRPKQYPCKLVENPRKGWIDKMLKALRISK